MTLIYVKHPLHGAMHVYSELEAVWHESIGWVRHPWPPLPEPDEARIEVKKRGPGRPRKVDETTPDDDV